MPNCGSHILEMYILWSRTLFQYVDKWIHSIKYFNYNYFVVLNFHQFHCSPDRSNWGRPKHRVLHINNKHIGLFHVQHVIINHTSTKRLLKTSYQTSANIASQQRELAPWAVTSVWTISTQQNRVTKCERVIDRQRRWKGYEKHQFDD